MTLSVVRSRFRAESGRPNESATNIDRYLTDEIEALQRDHRYRFQLARATVTVATGATVAALPSKYSAMRDVFLISTAVAPSSLFVPTRLRRVELDELLLVYGNLTGIPSVYAVDSQNTRIRVAPAPRKKTRFEFIYDQSMTLPATGSTSGNNQFFRLAPEVVLYGALTRLPPSKTNRDDFQFWRERYAVAKQALKEEHGVEMYRDDSRSLGLQSGNYRRHFQWTR
jgi:hypothetical protein